MTCLACLLVWLVNCWLFGRRPTYPTPCWALCMPVHVFVYLCLNVCVCGQIEDVSVFAHMLDLVHPVKKVVQYWFSHCFRPSLDVSVSPQLICLHRCSTSCYPPLYVLWHTRAIKGKVWSFEASTSDIHAHSDTFSFSICSPGARISLHLTHSWVLLLFFCGMLMFSAPFSPLLTTSPPSKCHKCPFCYKKDTEWRQFYSFPLSGTINNPGAENLLTRCVQELVCCHFKNIFFDITHDSFLNIHLHKKKKSVICIKYY